MLGTVIELIVSVVRELRSVGATEDVEKLVRDTVERIHGEAALRMLDAQVNALVADANSVLDAFVPKK